MPRFRQALYALYTTKLGNILIFPLTYTDFFDVS